MNKKIRKIDDFSNNVQYILKSMCYNYKGDDVTLEGSAGRRQIIFPADYDLYEKVKTKNIKYIQTIIKNLMNMKDVYIGDIKWGKQNKKPLRWKPKDILNGELKGVTLEQGIKTGLCKLDVIAFLDNVYTDLSIIYDFGYNKDSNIEKDLLNDKLDLVNEGNYFKATKRHLSMTILKNEKNRNVKLLTNFFNGNCGILYQILCNIKTLIFMLENYHNLSFKKIDSELDTMINRLSSCFYIIPYLKDPEKVNNMLRQMEGIQNGSENYKKFRDKLQRLFNYLDAILQKATKKYIKDNNIWKI